MALILSVAACGTLKTRDDVSEPAEAPRPPSPVGSVVQTSPTAPPASPVAPPIAHAPPSAPSAPENPAFLQKEAPRVGLILGAGAMKAFAHVGVLKEFARARIPISSIAGLEWGAAMAGIFALQGQANEVEWKSLRLRENELPSSSFFGGGAKAQPIAILRDFLEIAFGRAQLERNRVDFACPAYSPKADKLLWLNRGSARDAIARCMSYPPFYLDAGGWIASPFAIEEAAAYLRARGANFVIFVNPLAGGDLLSDKQQDVYADGVLWAEVKRHAGRAQIPGVNAIISVNTAGHPLNDFEGRRQIMDAGSKAAADVVNKLVSKYGF